MYEMNKVKLKIKLKSLAEEARIIKKEELKHKFHENVGELTTHRRWDVRNEARATGLALAFMRGKRYKQIEKRIRDNEVFIGSIMPRVVRILKKYHDFRFEMDNLTEWVLEDV